MVDKAKAAILTCSSISWTAWLWVSPVSDLATSLYCPLSVISVSCKRIKKCKKSDDKIPT